MRKQTGNVELIEVFAPDDAALWADDDSIIAEQLPASGTPPGRQTTRRGLLLAAAIAVAAIGGTIAFSDDNNTESASITTPAQTPTTQRPLLDPTSPTHFLIDDPSLTAYSADLVTPPDNGQRVRVFTDGTTTGPIVVVELHPHEYQPYGIVGATRDVVEGVELVRSTTACSSPVGPVTTRCELVVSEVAIDSSWSVTVRATRLKDADVVKIVRGLIDGALVRDTGVIESLGLGLTLEDESLDDLIFGRVESAVRYLTAGGEIATLRSAVGNPDSWLAGIRSLATDVQPSFSGRTYGYLMETGEAVVLWEEDGRLLSLVGPGNAGDLATISRQVRPATNAEWSAMLYGLRPDFTVGSFATLAAGHTSNGELWRAGPQVAERDGRTEFLWWWTVPGRDDFADSAPASLTTGSQPGYETVAVPGATFVFVAQPAAGGPVTVRSSSGREYTAELTQPFTQSTVYMTVVRIEEPGPVTVTIDGVKVFA